MRISENNSCFFEEVKTSDVCRLFAFSICDVFGLVSVERAVFFMVCHGEIHHKTVAGNAFFHALDLLIRVVDGSRNGGGGAVLIRFEKLVEGKDFANQSIVCSGIELFKKTMVGIVQSIDKILEDLIIAAVTDIRIV